jgi:hypothetical protein
MSEEDKQLQDLYVQFISGYFDNPYSIKLARSFGYRDVNAFRKYLNTNTAFTKAWRVFAFQPENRQYDLTRLLPNGRPNWWENNDTLLQLLSKVINTAYNKINNNNNPNTNTNNKPTVNNEPLVPPTLPITKPNNNNNNNNNNKSTTKDIKYYEKLIEEDYNQTALDNSNNSEIHSATPRSTATSIPIKTEPVHAVDKPRTEEEEERKYDGNESLVTPPNTSGRTKSVTSSQLEDYATGLKSYFHGKDANKFNVLIIKLSKAITKKQTKSKELKQQALELITMLQSLGENLAVSGEDVKPQTIEAITNITRIIDDYLNYD